MGVTEMSPWQRKCFQDPGKRRPGVEVEVEGGEETATSLRCGGAFGLKAKSFLPCSFSYLFLLKVFTFYFMGVLLLVHMHTTCMQYTRKGHQIPLRLELQMDL